MQNIQDILQEYWGFKDFRSLQEDIINSVLNGNDTLALLPTGGGKSLCFQVPALAKEGICLVVSPLIALMKDQVENLKKRNIKAIAITSGMSKREIDLALDNCVYGDIKFLYISPERLATEIFKVRVTKMKVNLIAVDEAHCISQWGYDFRPSYLNIAEIREILPHIPVLALTATATPDVVKDIQQKLLFKKPNVLQKSFERKNISYLVLKEDDKLGRLSTIINKVPGSGIIYVRNRKKTEEIAHWLNRNQISSDFYHAGISGPERDQKQEAWIKNKTRVIVCTNAFGMGIDKPDVRFVVHLDVPDNLEAYFQEAGRAGRDEKKAYAVILYNASDKTELQNNFIRSYPTIEEIKLTYQCIANFFQIPVGSALGQEFELDISLLCSTYKQNAITVFNSLKILEKEGYLTLSDSLFQPSRVFITLSNEELYKYQVANKNADGFIKLLLRTYSGLFDGFVKIDEWDLARKTSKNVEGIKKFLEFLHKNGIISYAPRTQLPILLFTKERIDVKNLQISKENLSTLKQRALDKLNSIIGYVENSHQCRNRQLLAYFGEFDSDDCGNCDFCINEKKKELSATELIEICNRIKSVLSANSFSTVSLIEKLASTNKDNLINAVQHLLDENEIVYNNEEKLELKK